MNYVNASKKQVALNEDRLLAVRLGVYLNMITMDHCLKRRVYA